MVLALYTWVISDSAFIGVICKPAFTEFLASLGANQKEEVAGR